MRSRREIAFRIKQEANNLRLMMSLPGLEKGKNGLQPLLPPAKRVAERIGCSSTATEILSLADRIIDHAFPVLGVTLNTGAKIDWRRDYIHERSSEKVYCRRIRYLDFNAVGDHKIIWELNRHQHLVLLAQAYCLSGRPEFLAEIVNQLRSWSIDNPFYRGINWASALEVGFRALSWIWIYHLLAEDLPSAFRLELATGLYRHALHLEYNLSIFFSPNTHLLGEAVALHAIGALFPDFPGSSRFKKKGQEMVELQMDAQVKGDGSHFEQSSYYHVYALDLFLLHAILAETTAAFKTKLGKMADYLNALLGPSRQLPLLGDDDGGRVFHPYGARPAFARASLATCSCLLGPNWPYKTEDLYPQAIWWLGGRAVPPCSKAVASYGTSRLFSDSGVLVMTKDEIQVICDAGPFGGWSAGHSHSDTLSVVIRRGNEDILIDPGTYCYIGDPMARDWFRGTSAHNTVRIDRHNQANVAGPFLWRDLPLVTITSVGPDFLDASCEYRGFIHRRQLHWLLSHDLLVVLDQITGPEGEHLIEQFWHPGGPVRAHSPRCLGIGCNTTITFADAPGFVGAWHSSAFYERTPATTICVARTGQLPMKLATVIDFSGRSRTGLRITTTQDRVYVELSDFPEAISFPDYSAQTKI